MPPFRQRVVTLDQQVVDLRLERGERDDELAAAAPLTGN
jgi:hypothetical protein